LPDHRRTRGRGASDGGQGPVQAFGFIEKLKVGVTLVPLVRRDADLKGQGCARKAPVTKSAVPMMRTAEARSGVKRN
jgi:hypothetical protein